MKQNVIYYQEFSNGDRVYAKILGVFKNGNFISVSLRKNVGRRAEKAKKYSIPKTWKDLWKEPENVPQDVLARFCNY
jgi:predicted RNA-binding protein with RPS1 domain